MDLPILFDWAEARRGVPFPFRWAPELGARIGLLPRGAKGSEVKWYPVDPCYVFHTLNAYDDGDRVVLEASRIEQLWAKGVDDTSAPPILTRFVVDPAAGKVTQQRLDDRMTDFPVLDPRVRARPHRYGYSLWLDPDTSYGPAWMKGMVKLDRQGDRLTALEVPRGLRPDEMTFVPAGPGEDEGYLVGFVYDAATDRSALWIVDARSMQGPICKIKLPFRVPFGFHGAWIPATSAG